MWEIELMTKAKCILPIYDEMPSSYRYTLVLTHIERLEREKNVLSLPKRDLERLKNLRTLKKQLIEEHKKDKEGVEENK